MGIKVQFNPSTQKVLFNPSTQKVQTVITSISSECEWCKDTQPAFIDVMFSGLANCNCITTEEECGGGYESYRISDVVESINDKTFRVYHDTGCIYKFSSVYPDNGIFERFFKAICEGYPYQTETGFTLIITLTLIESGIDVDAKIQVPGFTGSSTWIIFQGVIEYSEGESCGETDNTAVNTTPCWCDCVPWHTFGICCGGIVGIAPVSPVYADTTAPIPNPAEWEVEPYEYYIGPNPWDCGHAMEAKVATDSGSPPVEYYFYGSDFNSGWQSSPSYSVEVGVKGLKITWKVKVRDSSCGPNETNWSEEKEVILLP